MHELPSVMSGRDLVPRAPYFLPRQDREWACWAIFSDRGEVIDIVTIMKDGSRGYSAVFGVLKHGKLWEAVDMWEALKASAFRKRIVNGAVL